MYTYLLINNPTQLAFSSISDSFILIVVSELATNDVTWCVLIIPLKGNPIFPRILQPYNGWGSAEKPSGVVSIKYSNKVFTSAFVVYRNCT